MAKPRRGNGDEPMIGSRSDQRRRQGARAVSAHSLPASGDFLIRERCEVIVEEVLTVDVEGVDRYSLMWTPTQSMLEPVGYTESDGLLAPSGAPEPLALAAGFCLTEGLIGGIEDVRSIAMCPANPRTVRVELVDPSRGVIRRRNGMVTSSCGLCGGSKLLENGLLGLMPVADALSVDGELLGGMVSAMRERQVIFPRTGGAHAAAVFDSGGTVLAAAEDLGRHNTLDKVIGDCLLRRQSMAACGVVLSSRVSFEMIVKAARAGLELVAAVSAPTSLAIEVAERYGITLCGFVRNDRATIYTHEKRVRDRPRALAQHLAGAG